MKDSRSKSLPWSPDAPSGSAFAGRALLPWALSALVFGFVAVALADPDSQHPDSQHPDPQHPDPQYSEFSFPRLQDSDQRESHRPQQPAAAGGSPFETTIRRPSGPPRVRVSQPDPLGREGSVACSTCHSIREPNLQTRRTTDLKQFHLQMPIAHGELGCYACHNPDDTDTLRLADSTTVDYADVMTLCSQCHGPQARDYEHGAHGGMQGHWDLSRGPRTRNNCVDCHDPHVPRFPKMQPTFKPRDRFLEPTGADRQAADRQAAATRRGVNGA